MLRLKTLRFPAALAVAGMLLGGCAQWNEFVSVLSPDSDEITEAEISALAEMETAAGSPDVHPAARHIDSIGKDVIAKMNDESLTKEARIEYFEGVLARDLDIPRIARFAVGKSWRRATDEQRKAFVEVFTKFVLDTYSNRLGGAKVGEISVFDVKTIKKDTLVRTKIKRATGKPLTADWRMREKDGRYAILDLAVEGISMAMTLRQEFSGLLRKQGMDGLISTLKTRTAS